MKKALPVFLALALLFALAAPALGAAVEEARIAGTFCYDLARVQLDWLNDFRTGRDAWYWNSDDSSKTVCEAGQLGAVRIDPVLEQIAMERARELALSYSHTRPNGERCFTLTVDGMQSWGENIAYGFSTAESVFTAWREDGEPYAGQGHRRNMLNAGYVAVGFGCFCYNGAYYWAQEFSYYDSGKDLPARADREDGTGAVAYDAETFGSGYWSDEGNCPAAYYTPPETEKSDFEIDETGVLTAYTGSGGAVTVPEGVTAIGDRAFYQSAVTSVTLPAGVKTIGERAFSHCLSLTEVTLPAGLTEIGKAAFSADGALKTLNLPESLESLGKGAFTGTALPAAVLPAGLAAIPDYLFSSCAALKSVTIPASVASVGEGAFLGCDALETVDFGGSMTQWRAVAIGAKNEPLTAAALSVGVGTEAVVFEDVDPDAYYAPAVSWAVEVGVSEGTSKAPPRFSPDAAVTRGQAVTFLWRARGCPEPETAENPFADVKKTDYFYKAVLWAVEENITNGRSLDRFAPGEPVKRGEMLTFLWRAMGRLGETEPYEGKPWYADAEYWASEVGLLEGMPTAYARVEPCPRSDVVYYLFHAILLSGAGGLG